VPPLSRPSRLTDTWLAEFIERPEECLWPEVRSMARELLTRRRADYSDAVRVRTNWEKLEAQL
jgi:hypothetical protein